MKQDKDQQITLELLTANTSSELIRGIGSVALLSEARAKAQADLGKVDTEWNAEVEAIDAKYKDIISDLSAANYTTQREIDDAHMQIVINTINGHGLGVITDEELTYIDGLLSYTGDGGYGSEKCFDFERAADRLAEFKQLEPGVRVLTCGYSDRFGGRKVPRDNIQLYDGGVLAEKPKLSLNKETWQLMPKILFNYEDGRKVEEDWSHRRVIGSEVDALVTDWMSQRDPKSAGEESASNLLNQLVALEPLKLDIPELAIFKAEVLEKVEKYFNGGSLEWDRNLGAIRIVGGPEMFNESVRMISSRLHGCDNTKLIRELAKILEPDYDKLERAAKYQALADATLFLENTLA